MGMAHAIQKGEKIKGASPELKKVAKSMKPGDTHDFAATKEKGLPKHVEEEGKPDFLDLDKDGNKTEPMKKSAHDAYVKKEAPKLAKKMDKIEKKSKEEKEEAAKKAQ
jgi:hypothetical protein